MGKTFKGRVVVEGALRGEAVVSRRGVNLLATFQKSAYENAPEIVASDQSNPDLYQKLLTGKILCLPQAIGSTSGGMSLHAVCHMNIAPAAMLFSKQMDSLSAAGIILAKIWSSNRIIAVDQLGEEFLAAVKDGAMIEIKPDGSVCVE